MLSMGGSNPRTWFSPCLSSQARLSHSLIFFIRTSNFGVEAERTSFLLRFEAESFLLKDVLKFTWYTKGPQAFYHECNVSSFKETSLSLQ